MRLKSGWWHRLAVRRVFKSIEHHASPSMPVAPFGYHPMFAPPSLCFILPVLDDHFILDIFDLMKSCKALGQHPASRRYFPGKSCSILLYHSYFSRQLYRKWNQNTSLATLFFWHSRTAPVLPSCSAMPLCCGCNLLLVFP